MREQKGYHVAKKTEELKEITNKKNSHVYFHTRNWTNHSTRKIMSSIWVAA